MSSEATIANQKRILANQKQILANQKQILANQKRIEASQSKLVEVLANRKKNPGPRRTARERSA